MTAPSVNSGPRFNTWTGGQYSVLRYLLGTGVAIGLMRMIAAALASYPQIPRVRGAGGPLSAVPVLEAVPIADHPAFVLTLLVLATLLSLTFAAGSLDRAAALVLAVVVAFLAAGERPVLHAGVWPLCIVFLLHALTPAAPYGSAAARGRVDPGGGWRMPAFVFAAGWVALAAIYLVDGVSKAMDPAWRDGSVIADAAPSLSGIAPILAWAAMIVLCGFAPLALWRRTRPWMWAAALLAVMRFLFRDTAEPMWGLLALHAFTFDPAWMPPRRVSESQPEPGRHDAQPPAAETVFYDGHCGLCQASVRFVLAEDADGSRFVYAPLQSDAFAEALPAETRATLPDSVIVRTLDGRVLVKSAAAAHILARLGGLWRIASWLLTAVPRPVRDFGYDCVARVRRRLFGQPKDVCPMMPKELRERFLV